MHMVGFLSERRLPIRRITGAPIPEKGAAQSLQRGPLGMCEYRRR